MRPSWGVRTRGLDIKAGAIRNAADKAAGAAAEAVIQRWNDQLALGRDMLWSLTIRAAVLAGTVVGSAELFPPSEPDCLKLGSGHRGAANSGHPAFPERQ